MFGSKKVEEVIKPMGGYPSDQLKDVKKALMNKAPHIITDIKWELISKIWIDRIQISKNAQGRIEIFIKDNPTKDYIKAWNLGLGKFIKKDLKSGENLDKYKFVYFPKEEGYKGLVAFIRYIDFSDIDDDCTIADLEKYNCISFDYTDENKNTKYVSVMKIFVKNESYSDEVMLNQPGKIHNVNDEYFDAEEEYFYSNLSEVASESDEATEKAFGGIDVDNKPTKSEDIYINQDTLF